MEGRLGVGGFGAVVSVVPSLAYLKRRDEAAHDDDSVVATARAAWEEWQASADHREVKEEEGDDDGDGQAKEEEGDDDRYPPKERFEWAQERLAMKVPSATNNVVKQVSSGLRGGLGLLGNSLTPPMLLASSSAVWTRTWCPRPF